MKDFFIQLQKNRYTFTTGYPLKKTHTLFLHAPFSTFKANELLHLCIAYEDMFKTPFHDTKIKTDKMFERICG